MKLYSWHVFKQWGRGAWDEADIDVIANSKEEAIELVKKDYPYTDADKAKTTWNTNAIIHYALDTLEPEITDIDTPQIIRCESHTD